MQKKILKLRAQVKYDPEVAKRAMDMRYYRAQDINMKKFAFIESEKLRLSTGKWKTITDIIMKYRLEGMNTISTTGKILNGIDEKNKMMAQGKIPFQKTTNILPIICKTETLLLAYKRIKRNKGALTRASDVDEATLNSYNALQRKIYYRKKIFPDGFSLRDVEIAGFLLLKGQYPWGSSRRIWIAKPGDPSKKRPITIPPFLDRIIQEYKNKNGIIFDNLILKK